MNSNNNGYGNGAGPPLHQNQFPGAPTHGAPFHVPVGSMPPMPLATTAINQSANTPQPSPALQQTRRSRRKFTLAEKDTVALFHLVSGLSLSAVGREAGVGAKQVDDWVRGYQSRIPVGASASSVAISQGHDGPAHLEQELITLRPQIDALLQKAIKIIAAHR